MDIITLNLLLRMCERKGAQEVTYKEKNKIFFKKNVDTTSVNANG